MKKVACIGISLGFLLFCSAVFLGMSNMVSASSTATAAVTVPVACTMQGVGTTHTATLAPNTFSGASGSEYENGIGKTTFTVVCNDYNGFAIYAVGYTNDSHYSEDNTKLIGASTGNLINTAVYENGNTVSSWSMKVNKVLDSTVSYNPQNLSILDSFNSWHVIPDAYTKVAQYKASTGSSTTDATLGAKFETTYAAYIAANQPADTYVGKVKYTMVHPYSELAPIECRPEGTTISTITCMQDVNGSNRDTIAASMTEGQQYTLYDKRDKKPYTVSKLADGNIWMTQNLDLDIDANTTYTNEDTDIGYVIEEGGYYTEASWRPVFSTIKGNSSAWRTEKYAPISYDPGEVYYDTNYRDYLLFSFYVQFYGVSGYQDTLLLIYDSFPSDIQAFVDSCDATFTICDDTLLSDEYQDLSILYLALAYSSSCQQGTCDSGIYARLPSDWQAYFDSCGANMTSCDESILPSSPLTGKGSSLESGISQHSIGNYYNWTAALATNNSGGILSSNGVIEQSICPSGWTLPRGKDSEDSYYALLNQYGYTSNVTDFTSNNWWVSPLYLVPGGAIGNDIGDDSNAVSMHGYYWSATSYSPDTSYGLKFNVLGQTNLQQTLPREKGFSVRCVARPVAFSLDGSPSY